METALKETKNANLTILSHPLIKHNLTVMRDKTTTTEVFNLALKRITYALFYESTKFLPTEDIKVETPIKKTTSKIISKNIDIFGITTK